MKNYNIAAKKKKGEVIFLRKIVRGGADQSYGIEVAKLVRRPRPGGPAGPGRSWRSWRTAPPPQGPMSPSARLSHDEQIPLGDLGGQTVLNRCA